MVTPSGITDERPADAGMAGPVYRFKYFKGFADAELALREPLTLLIGRNGSGKSNIIEGIHLLGELAHGTALHEVASPGQRASCEVRGGLAGCPTMGERWFELGYRSGPIAYDIAIRPEVAQIEAESLRFRDVVLFEVADRLTNVRRRIVEVTYNPSPPSPLPNAPPHEMLSADHSVLSSYPGFVEVHDSSESREVAEHVERFKVELGASVVLSPQPEAMREYDRTGLALARRAPARTGRNISAILYDLSNGSEVDRESFRRIEQRVCELPEHPFAKIDFVTSTAGDVMLALQPARAGQPAVDARLVSDGTLRYLAILTALETLPEGALLLLEDFDVGLHPSRVAALLRALWERCIARRLRAIVTTHNPAVLDALDARQLRGVVVCYQDVKRDTAALCPLHDIPEADVLLMRGSLGDLLTRQVLEQHLMPGFSEKRRQEALRWLEELP